MLENSELMTINDELRSEIGSQNESIIESNEFKKLNTELQDDDSENTSQYINMSNDYKNELDLLQINLDEFSEQASRAEILENEVIDLRNIKNDQDKTNTELKFQKNMNTTLISIIEHKHKTIQSTDDSSLDPLLMKTEIEEMKEVNKWLRQELEVKDNKLNELNDKIDSLKYLNQQICKDDGDLSKFEEIVRKKNSYCEQNLKTGRLSGRTSMKNCDTVKNLRSVKSTGNLNMKQKIAELSKKLI